MSDPSLADGHVDETPPRVTQPYHRTRSGMLTGLFILAIFYTIYFTSALLIPIILAVIFNLLLSPIVRWLNRRLRLPTGLAAGMVLLILLSSIAGAFYSLSDPATRWLRDLPTAAADIKGKVEAFRKPVKDIQDAASKVQDLAEEATGNGGDSPAMVTIQGPDLTQMVLGGTLSFAAGLMIAAVLLFFMLASNDTLLRQAISVIPRFREKKQLVEMIREMEDDISFYLLTISIINGGLGLAVGGLMYLLDMPNPILWGVMAAVFNYVPLLGSMAGIGVVTLVALLTFDSFWAILLPPLGYFVLTALEGQLVTPAIVARRMSLNPVAVFLSLILWTWLWGIAGALLAVPILATFKICCDHIEPLKPTGAMLGQSAR